VPRRAAAWLALVAVVGTGIAVWQLRSGSPAGASVPVATATRGDVVVTVGGLGRVVEATTSAQIAVPTSASSPSTGPSGGTASAPADAVFPRAAGRVSRFLVSAGERVRAAQPLALLDDGGSAPAAAGQAETDLATAMLELQQKRTADPLKGVPPAPAELAAAHTAVTSARQRLARLLGPPRRADLSAARLDVRRAESDLQTLMGGTTAARAAAIRIARQNVQLAKERLDRVLAPPDPADVNAAEAELKKSEAELATLQRPAVTPSPEALAAAQLAVTWARADLAAAQKANDNEALLAAQEALDGALADLAALLKPGPGALPVQIDAARKAVEAARAKLEKLLRPPNPAEVSAARLELERAQADLRTLEAGPTPAGLTAARQAVAAARARLAQLLGPPLRSDVTGARLDVRKALADQAVLRARGGPASSIDVSLAELRVRAARARLAIARFATRQLTVRAPSAGTVTGLLTVVGAPVDASTPIVTVADLQHLAVSVALSEFDAARVKRGLPAVVSVDALGGKRFPGKVLFEALTGVDNGGVVTFPVRVGLSRLAGVRPGMNVSVRIIVASRRGVVRVPLEAVSRGESGAAVVDVVGSSGQTVSRRVTLGLANNKDVEIARGLRAGERVALAGSQGE
jgi:RND family efflux transporter MFP subunit